MQIIYLHIKYLHISCISVMQLICITCISVMQVSVHNWHLCTYLNENLWKGYLFRSYYTVSISKIVTTLMLETLKVSKVRKMWAIIWSVERPYFTTTQPQLDSSCKISERSQIYNHNIVKEPSIICWKLWKDGKLFYKCNTALTFNWLCQLRKTSLPKKRHVEAKFVTEHLEKMDQT